MSFTINFGKCGLRSFDKPVVMGILNATPDSFYAGSRANSDSEILHRAEQMITEGAQMIDIGGFSTRPGAVEVSEAEELDRVCNAVSLVRKQFPDIIISVDTFRSSVAKESVVSCGADVINDISAGALDGNLFATVAELGVPYILMHSLGNSVSAQQLEYAYSDFMGDVIKFFADKIEQLRLLGVKDIIVDPGFGFSKTMDQNYKLLANLKSFEIFKLPVLVGVSRKRMAWQVAETTIEESLNATTAINTLALASGMTDILRVHDVKAAVEAVKIWEKMLNSKC
ncbi:MAG: dihydropteroate synthase [Paludibacteraceae bacterium]|nr:dihydropteroate synthase [Paludibacteraceae bacterium]